ncbi:NADPH:quinone oxidoreductase family protein [Sphingobium sp. HBC34]|uniref:NADPH:quinone oxidoreductase family protein n=1 Tax=Sphingobium cyanobacteriorum TaxID=3063954 RepID=A0ABT8ZPJ1_9SPHN|nr:NADPH:quinone oxidoreductase family protein [Sphingobium sp. HBC34]MDO7836447.1 NADPH:quinone oxidoreductase family protein [Sphingobium sp. HBC34]
MAALVCEAFSPLPRLCSREVAIPEPGIGEIRLKVACAGLGFVDALVCSGEYQVKPPLPFTPGNEVAGCVDAVGAGVTSLKPGDRVAALVAGGGLGEYALAREALVVAIPDALPFLTAAACVTNYTTVAFGLQGLGRPAKGETMLVLGAGGGLGMAALDFGRMLGLRTIALASNEEKRRAANMQGATIVMDYSGGDWRRAVEAEIGKAAVDIIFDPVGGAMSEPAFRLLAIGGRHLVLGFASGEIARLPLNLPLLRRADIIGVDWGGAVRGDVTLFRPTFAPVAQALADGVLRPTGIQPIAFRDSQEALARLRNRQAHGKSVVEVALENRI